MHPSPAAAEHLSQVRSRKRGHLVCAFLFYPSESTGWDVCPMTLEIIKTSSEQSAGACWSCGNMRGAQFCGACGKVQPPAPVDYFSFFGLPRKLNIDIKTLEKEFYALSRKLHPDIYANSGEKEKHWSEEQSSHLNDAYRTL